MATKLTDYLEGKECKAFVQRPHYFRDGDYVTYFATDVLAKEERVDELLTVYRSVSTGELIGCKIKGVRRMVDTLGAFAVVVEGKSLCLGMLFVAAAILRPASKDNYEKVSKAYANVAFDPTEFPMKQAA
jgi:hypothetical protein